MQNPKSANVDSSIIFHGISRLSRYRRVTMPATWGPFRHAFDTFGIVANDAKDSPIETISETSRGLGDESPERVARDGDSWAVVRTAIGGERVRTQHHCPNRRWAEQVRLEPGLWLYALLEPESLCSRQAFEVRRKTYAGVARPLCREKIGLRGTCINGRSGDRANGRERV
jgi:hypothetical protein